MFYHLQGPTGPSPSTAAGQNATSNSVPSYPGAQQPMAGNYNQYAQYYAGATAAANQGNYGAGQPYNAYGAAYQGQQPPNQAQSQPSNEKK